MTASKLIVILTLSKMIATAQGLDVDMDTWSKGYCNATQDSVGIFFCPPSLSFLAKYWQDPQGEQIYMAIVTICAWYTVCLLILFTMTLI